MKTRQFHGFRFGQSPRLFILLLLLMGGHCGMLYAQVTAGFTANVTSGCGSILVYFTNTSTGPVTGYNWNFGNGSTSTLPSPGTIYSTPGTYTVTLTVTGPGSSNTLVRNAYITVYAKPTAIINATPTMGCAPLNVQFSNASTPGSGTLVSQTWDFGDGNTSTLANPPHTFLAGNYNVRVTATNSNGCSATSPPRFIQALAPITAGFRADTTQACNFPFTVQFTDTSLGTGPFTYAWDFGDGNTATGSTTPHTYATPGNYTVTLIVTRNGCSDTAVRPNFIQYLPMQAGFVASDTQVCKGTAIAFQDMSLGNPTSWAWDFGDGGTSTLQNPSHPYATSGFKTVTLVVTNALGCTDTLQNTNGIEILVGPTVAFSAPTTTGCSSPLAVAFANSSTGGNTYLWDFGDGNTSTAFGPAHNYTVPGNLPDSFDVKLLVTDVDGCVDSLTLLDFVIISPPVAAFTYNVVQSGCRPRNVQFTDASTSAFDPINAWDWDFGDLPNSNNQNPNHNYNTVGIWTVSLIVTTVSGCKDTLTLPNYLSTGNAPNASFTVSNASPCFGTPVTFTSTSTGSPNAYFWDFGNGFVPGTAVQLYTFPDTGCYSVNFIASQNGCDDSPPTPATVCVRGVRAQFALSSPAACQAPAMLGFTNQSVSSNPLSYDWDFGDGTAHSILASPAPHNYAAAGTYTITLTATDNVAACSNTITRTFTIGRPTAGFSPNLLSGCASQAIIFNNTSTNAATYEWSFGDGTGSTVTSPTHTYNYGGGFSVELIAIDSFGCSDTLRQNSLIRIHDVEPDFMRTPSFACLGDTVYFTDASGSDGIINGWDWDFGDGTTSTVQNPPHLYTAIGIYDVKLIAHDNNGCSDSITRMANVNVVQATAAFTMSALNLCPGQTLLFYNASSGIGPLAYSWNFGDGGVDSIAFPSHVYAAAGVYVVKMEVTDAAGCKAVAIHNVTVAQPVAAFTVSDSISNCPPLPVQFTNTSTGNIAGWQWLFGDGSGSLQQHPYHLYDSAGTYTVQLIVITPSGCRDTVTIPGRVVVGGPTLSFQASDSIVCTGADVQFFLQASGSVTPIWDFGDGNLLVGGDTVIHSYVGANVYTPVLIALDSLGCAVTAPSIGQITVLAGPQAAMLVDTSVHCHPDSIAFTDQSTYSGGPSSQSWDFGDGSNGAGGSVTHYYAAAGSYDVVLSVVDALGCTDIDTVLAAVIIHAQTALFGADSTTGCLPATIQFHDSSSADNPIVAWAWNFGDGSTGTTPNPSHIYTDTGAYNVTLIVTTALGCQDTLTLPSFIDTHPPQVPRIWAASVEGNQTVSVLFRADNSALFDSYELYHVGGSYVHIASTYLQTDTLLFDLAANSLVTSNCYVPMVADVCRDSSALPPARVHCTMELQTIPGIDQNTLTWTPYMGWDSILRYEVYQVADYDTTAGLLLATVPANTTVFVDSASGCAQLSMYRVRAIGLAQQERSWSDTSGAQPAHVAPSYQPQMVTATVLNNADVQVNWITTPLPGNTSTELFRSLDGTTWASLATLPAPTASYLDATANVGAQSYYYQVEMADSCGYRTQPSGHARSIVLQLDGSDGTAQLQWNAYGDWVNGVARYELEVRPMLGTSWLALATVNGATLTYHDEVAVSSADGVCYRITAYETAGNLALSRSNEVCFSNELWVPNTITPNNDALNDVLIVRGIAAYPGTGITIYNRWGNVVYEVDDYANDWAGTNGKRGEPLPDGTYFWVLKVSDGRQLRGYVTILR